MWYFCNREQDEKSKVAGGILGDEEDFPTHAPYNATISSYPSTFKNGDTLNSRMGLYDNKGLNYPWDRGCAWCDRLKTWSALIVMK